MTAAQFTLAVGVMVSIVVASNVLVQYPINPWLTWGAVSYPFAFLLADLLNRRFGAAAARRVAYVGFAFALVASVWVASPALPWPRVWLSCAHKSWTSRYSTACGISDGGKRHYWEAWQAPSWTPRCSSAWHLQAPG